MTWVRRLVVGFGLVGLPGLVGCPAAKPEFPSAEGGTSGDDDSGSAGTSADDGDDASTGSGSSGGAPMDGETGVAPGMLVVDASVVDFGDVNLGFQQTTEIVLRNSGDTPVSAIEAAPLTEPFAFFGDVPGAEFPGEGGDCGDTLAGGASCRVVLSLQPTEFGPHTGSLTLRSDTGEIVVPLSGRGVGSTANLLVNGDGEQQGSPPPGWTESEGSWNSGALLLLPAYEGLGALAATEAYDETWTTLRQDVSIVAYADLVAAGELRVRLDGWVRVGPGNGDLAWVGLEMTGMAGAVHEWESRPESPLMWTSLGHELPIAPGTVQIGVQLFCAPLGAGEDCEAYFDEVSLVLVYAPAGG